MQIYNEDELVGIKVSSKITKERRVFVFYEGMISANFVPYILQELNTYEEYKDFILILNSGGGDVAYINPFCAIMKNFNLIGICGLGQASSAALAIMLKCKENKIQTFIDPYCHIILHRVVSVSMGEERSERIKEYNEKWVEKYEKGFDLLNSVVLNKLTKAERDNYALGYNVYLLGQELISKKIFKDIKEMNNG